MTSTIVIGILDVVQLARLLLDLRGQDFDFSPDDSKYNYNSNDIKMDRLCGLVVRVPGYRYRDTGFDYRRYHIFREVVGLERGPLSREDNLGAT
jgi:hypothetical protein